MGRVLSADEAAKLRLPPIQGQGQGAPKILNNEDAKALGLPEIQTGEADPFPPIPKLPEQPDEEMPKKVGRVVGEALLPGLHEDIASVKTGHYDDPEAKNRWEPEIEAKRNATAKNYEGELNQQRGRLATARKEYPKTDIAAHIGALLIGPNRGVNKLATEVGTSAVERMAARGLGNAAMNAPRAAHESATAGEGKRMQAGRGLQSAALSTLFGFVPGGGHPIVQSLLGAATGAASERVGRVMEPGGGLKALTEEPEAMITPAIVGAAAPLVAAGAAWARGKIRDPNSVRGEAINDFEKAGGKITPVRGAVLPKADENLGPRPVQKVAGDTARAALKKNFEGDTESYKQFREREEVLSMRSEANRPLQNSEAIRKKLLRQVRALKEDTITSEGDRYPGANTELDRWEKFLSKPVKSKTKLDVVGEDVADTIGPGGKTITDSSVVPPEARKTVNQKARTINEGGKTRIQKMDIPAPPSEQVEADMTRPRQLTLRDLVKLRRALDESGKVGQAAGRSEMPFKKLAKLARRILGTEDPQGFGKLFSEESKALTEQSTRNENLGLQPKPRIAPSGRKVEAVAGRLASTRGTDTRAAARGENVEAAAEFSPDVQKQLPRIRGLQAYERLRWKGEPLDIGIYGGNARARTVPGLGVNLADALTLRADPTLRLFEEQLSPPSIAPFLLTRPRKKKEAP